MSLSCSDVYSNVGGDWTSCLVGQDGVNDNFSEDPLFCDAVADDYTLDDDSPCLPASNDCGELVGARGQGCTTIGVEDAMVVPARLVLEGNAPNPFNPSTTIFYGVPEDGDVTLTIHDLSGRLIRRLMTGSRSAGHHRIAWHGVDEQGRTLAGGVYFVLLEQAGAREARKIVMIK